MIRRGYYDLNGPMLYDGFFVNRSLEEHSTPARRRYRELIYTYSWL